MYDNIENLELFNIHITCGQADIEDYIEEGEDSTGEAFEFKCDVNGTEAFDALCGDDAMFAEMILDGIGDFTFNLLNFIMSRSEIVDDEENMHKAIVGMGQMDIYILWNMNDHAIIVSEDLDNAFTDFAVMCGEEKKPEIDLFWKFIQCEVRDMEGRLTYNINSFVKNMEDENLTIM